MSIYEDAHPCLNSLIDIPDYDDPFNPRHAEQVSRAMYDLLTDMCTVSDVKGFDDMKPANIKQNFVFGFANPHLQMAVERLVTINTERLAEQKTVIELQSKLIEKHDEELSSLKAANKEEVKSVLGVVETKMKSYSSALKKTALAPKKIRTAMNQDSDEEDCSRNVIIYGMKDSTEGEQKLEQEVSEIFTEIDEKPVIRDCCRVGTMRTGNIPPVKITLTSSDMVNHMGPEILTF